MDVCHCLSFPDIDGFDRIQCHLESDTMFSHTGRMDVCINNIFLPDSFPPKVWPSTFISTRFRERRVTPGCPVGAAPPFSEISILKEHFLENPV